MQNLLNSYALHIALSAAAAAIACDPGAKQETGELPTSGRVYKATPGAAGAAGGPGVTPVEMFGQLSVEGPQLVGEDGEPVQLRGASSMWLNWEDDGYAESFQALEWMRDNWNLSVIRAAMGIEPNGAYLSNPDKALQQVTTIVENAIEAGVYVIIDWHDHMAHEHRDEAVEFFAQMSEKYGEYPNVIYETFNEPEQISWSTELKPYHEAVVSSIRRHDPDNIVILGTPVWSQQVDVAAFDPVGGTNLMYTVHFYACDHTSRTRAVRAMQKGLAVFVTEWGATKADGGVEGDVCLDNAQAWTDWMRSHGISWTAWKLDNCTDLSCYFKSSGVSVDGNWTDADLWGHGPFVRDRMRE
ncbi:MAG TPA: glycoside hydrolase family 5 protein [Polyangiaceae bacterium]|nr:glycoside hydrolase family 5 protein [Polyangiaceae bacterium]